VCAAATAMSSILANNGGDDSGDDSDDDEDEEEEDPMDKEEKNNLQHKLSDLAEAMQSVMMELFISGDDSIISKLKVELADERAYVFKATFSDRDKLQGLVTVLVIIKKAIMETVKLITNEEIKRFESSATQSTLVMALEELVVKMSKAAIF
jgi:succinate dehydrogenase/fumarate reductase flavoprotein subunit